MEFRFCSRRSRSTGNRWPNKPVKLNSQQLQKHLSAGVAPVYMVSGDEPLLVDEALDSIRKAAHEQGYEDREAHVAERGFDWSGFQGGLQNLSLFATRRLVELRLPTGKPGDQGARFVASLFDKPVSDTVVIFITPALDKKTAQSKWASRLAKDGVSLTLRSPNQASMPGWLQRRLKRAGLTLDAESLELFTARVEGNLLAAKQEIDKLAILSTDGRVTFETMRASVADGARFDVFHLTDAALAGERKRAARILQVLEREGVPTALVMWSLAREVTVLADVVYRLDSGQSPAKAMSAASVWDSRQNLIGRAARSRDLASTGKLVSAAARTDRIVKGARKGRPWNALLELTLALAGTQELSAETSG